MKLENFFIEYPSVAIAFSGGVDSAYLLYAAIKYANKVQAYYVKSAFQPQFELDDAIRLTTELGVQMKTISLDILSEKEITCNDSNRCYYCKKRIFHAIAEAAKKDGFLVLLDGTNASDDAKERPGMKALQELSVRSPLRDCGLTKSEIRKLSKAAGLFTWDKPAYACLATRISTGQAIDFRLLQRTEKAENYLFSLGFSDFRIRTVDETAKIQITKEQFLLLAEKRENIVNRLKEDYQSVCLDLEVRDEHGNKANS